MDTYNVEERRDRGTEGGKACACESRHGFRHDIIKDASSCPEG